VIDLQRKLGIYIPTYNRRERLEECLRSIMPQLKNYGFPVFISDNSKGGETEALIKQLKEEYADIYYKKNDSGLGNTYAANLVSLLAMINTEFVWLFGDDDLMKEGAVDKIVKEISDYDFLQINSEIWNNDFSKILIERKIKESKDKVYLQGEHEKVLVNATDGYAGFMGSIITRGEYLKEEFSKIKSEDLSNKDYLHMTLFFRSIVGKRGKFISEPLIKYRNLSNLGGKEFEIWMYSFPKALEELRSLYSDSILKHVGTLPVYSMVGIACINKIQNPDKIRFYKELIGKNTAMNIAEKSVLSVLIRIPDPVIKIMIYPSMKRNKLTMEKG
jgi:glycosyltransferase involved in cell wall biosynthesis